MEGYIQAGRKKPLNKEKGTLAILSVFTHNKKRDGKKKSIYDTILGINHPHRSKIDYFTFHLSFLLKKSTCTKIFIDSICR